MPSRAAAYLRLTGLSLALKFWTVARTQRAFYGRDGLWPADDASRAERREVLAWAGLALAIACAVGGRANLPVVAFLCCAHDAIHRQPFPNFYTGIGENYGAESAALAAP